MTHSPLKRGDLQIIGAYALTISEYCRALTDRGQRRTDMDAHVYDYLRWLVDNMSDALEFRSVDRGPAPLHTPSATIGRN